MSLGDTVLHDNYSLGSNRCWIGAKKAKSSGLGRINEFKRLELLNMRQYLIQNPFHKSTTLPIPCFLKLDKDLILAFGESFLIDFFLFFSFLFNNFPIVQRTGNDWPRFEIIQSYPESLVSSLPPPSFEVKKKGLPHFNPKRIWGQFNSTHATGLLWFFLNPLINNSNLILNIYMCAGMVRNSWMN